MADTLSREFGIQLRNCRKLVQSERLTQQALADALGIDVAIISKYEGGKLRPDEKRLGEILEFLRAHDVPDAEREKLKKSAMLAEPTQRRFSVSSLVKDPITSAILAKLSQLDISPTDKDALQRDIENVLNGWTSYWQAQSLTRKGNIDLAKHTYESILSSKTDTAVDLHVRVLEGLARMLRYEGSVHAALEYLEMARALLPKDKGRDQFEEAEILRQEGDIYRRQGEWKHAKEAYESSMEIYSKLGEDRYVADLYRKQVGLSLLQGDAGKETLRLCDRSEALCKRLGYQDGLRKVHQQRAWSQAMQGNLDEAIKGNKQALKMAQDGGANKRELAKCYRYLGDVYRMADLLDEAEKNYSDAEEHLRLAFGARDLQDEKLIRGMILHGQGSLQLERRNYLEALRLLQNSLLIHIQTDDKISQGLNLSQLGRLYTAMGNFDAAERHLQQAYRIFNQDEQPSSKPVNVYYEAAVLINQATLKYKQQDYQHAIELVQKSIAISTAHDLNVHLARAKILLGTFLLDPHVRASKEASELYTSGVDLAIDLQPYLTNELLQRISTQIEKIIKNNDAQTALALCLRLTKQWKQKLEPPTANIQALIDQWLQRTDRTIQLLRGTLTDPENDLPD